VTNFTTIAGDYEDVELERCEADLYFGSRWKLANDIFARSDSEYSKDFVWNERIMCSHCCGLSSGDSKSRPWKRSPQFRHCFRLPFILAFLL